MRYLVFDVEATGLGGTDEVFQFAGLLLGRNLQIKKGINFYCYAPVPIHPRAKQLTKMTSCKLMQLSDGKYFEDYYYSLDIFKEPDLTWIGYNVSYDMGIINNTLRNNGLPTHCFGNSVANLTAESGVHNFDLLSFISSMNGGMKRPLSAMQQDLGYSVAKLEEMYQKLLKLLRMESTVRQHNALYDSMVTWLLLCKYKEVCTRWTMHR